MNYHLNIVTENGNRALLLFWFRYYRDVKALVLLESDQNQDHLPPPCLLVQFWCVHCRSFHQRSEVSMDTLTGLQLHSPKLNQLWSTGCSDSFLWEPASPSSSVWAPVSRLLDQNHWSLVHDPVSGSPPSLDLCWSMLTSADQKNVSFRGAGRQTNVHADVSRNSAAWSFMFISRC